MRRTLALIAAVALTGCSLEPKYIRPTPAIPQSWPIGDPALRASEAGLASVSYRQIFPDTRLHAIIARALVNNQDLRVALANVEAARGLYRVERAARLPAIDASAALSVRDNGTGSSNSTVVQGGRRTDYSVDIGVSAFELDLFGRVRSLSNAALNSYFATESAARAARLTLVSDIADAWFTLATDRSLLAIAQETVRSAERSVTLTRARLTGGIAPRTDLRQAETILATAQSDVANYTAIVAQDRNAIVLLVGGPVSESELPPSIESAEAGVATVPVGLDSSVLLRRPDVVEAEFQLRAANARIGAARAAFFPRISLTGIAGLASSALTSLFSSGSFNYSAGPSLSLPIFDGGANRGNLDYARAQAEAATATYQRAIQGAFRDVADALARRATIADQAAAQTRLFEAANDTAQLTDARYRGGVASFLESLDAQRTVYSARRALATTRLVRASNTVALYRALGGDELAEANR